MNIRNDIQKKKMDGKERDMCVGYNCPTAPLSPRSLRQNSSDCCDSTSDTLGRRAVYF